MVTLRGMKSYTGDHAGNNSLNRGVTSLGAFDTLRRLIRALFLYLAAWFLADSVASGQDSFLDRWKELAAKQPEGVKFLIAASKREFYLGEAIRLKLSFTSSEATGFQFDTRMYDRVGRMNYIEQFVVDPASNCEDPLQGLQGGVGGMGGLSGGPVPLSAKPFVLERLLNEWVRCRMPGEYRVYVVSRRISRKEAGQPWGGKAIELVSNVLRLSLRSAPGAWVRQQIDAAKKTLDTPETPGDQARNARQEALRTLRFLDSPEAAEELVRRLPSGQDVDSFLAYQGVLGSPSRRQLLPLMERGLVDAGQPVWERYLTTLAHLAELVGSGGPMLPYPADAGAQKQWQSESQRRIAVQEQKRNEYASRLVSALPGKQPPARAISLNTLLELGLRGPAEPPWFASVATSLVADFRNLPVMTQSMLLEYRWSALKGPAMLPVLRELVANPPSPHYQPSIQETALRRLYQLAPDEGRRIILDEIRQPARHLPLPALAMLPDATLPDLDEVLAERMDQLLILRYATGRVAKRVEERYLARQAEIEKQNLPTCAGPLAFYFLKHDPPVGERLLRSDFSKNALMPSCYDIGFQFQQLGRWAYSPALERLAIDSLTSPIVAVKRGAAELLGKYGSKAAQKPLWETMEYFRSWWKGREQELTQKVGQESMQLERTLRIALAQADGWVLTESDLQRLLILCSSAWCRSEVNGWISTAKAPLSIQVYQGSEGFGYGVGQYQSGGEDWLGLKVLQYPEGTEFKVARSATESQMRGLREARDRAQQIVLERGGRLVR
jgi:hypothetical protein